MNLREKLLKGNLDDPEILRGLFDLARNDTDVDLGRQARSIAGDKARKFATKPIGKEFTNLYWEIMLWLARNGDFDSYLLYLEKNRPPEKRFYQNRRAVMKVLVDAIQELLDDKLDELFISMPPRVGKLLADDTPVLTTEGWKRHGDLDAGDMVFAPDGRAIKVLAAHAKNNTTHTVTMTDGSEFKCHFRHEWQVYDRRFGKVRTLETQEMIGHLMNGNRYNFQLLQKEPLIGVEKELPVKPYTFGAWLGDGNNNIARINGDRKDHAIIEGIEADGYHVRTEYTHKTTGVVMTVFDSLREDLHKIGLCYNHRRVEKYIPDEYLTASCEQRLELLAGLLDTDGSLRRKERRYDFTTADQKLRDGVLSLVSTFGWRCSLTERKPRRSSSGIEGKKTYWIISFNPTRHIPCRLERKRLFEFSKPRRIAVKSIVESEPVQGNCISVEGGMYLAGEKLTPTHNTAFANFLTSYIVGLEPESTNLYCSCNTGVAETFYKGVTEIINDDATYTFFEIFPDAKVAGTNSKEHTLDMGRAKKYPTLRCVSIDQEINGKADCNRFLIGDDLCSGIEEALSPDRLEKKWSIVQNNLIPRQVGKNGKIIWIGTRWSIYDPIGRQRDILESEPQFASRRWRALDIPALDENEESNFDYPNGMGFSTEQYIQRRAVFERDGDMASWLAQYQAEPIERSGQVFDPNMMRFYNGVLPEGEPDRVFSFVDTAFGGGDYVSAPVAYQYGDEIYIHDVVFDAGDKFVTRPLLVDLFRRNNVGSALFEGTKTTAEYREWVDNKLRELNFRCNIMSKAASTQKRKEERIFEKAPEIREFYFRDRAHRSPEYEMFMRNLNSFTMTGKNKHDDAPDSLAGLCDMIRRAACPARVINRPF